VKQLVTTMEASPDHTNFVYVPFNEPDGEVYGSYDKGITNLAVLESAWKTIYQTIRTINPSAEIAGPNFFLYDNSAYTNFMTYAKSNDVLPNEVTWHEFESSLGISPIKVVIDEYAQSAELGVPGTLVQYIARFENSKVYGCLAYWTSEGDLQYLGASGSPNVATGAWWLYQWYGEMAGNTFKGTPPSTTTQGWQGVAALDSNSKQVKAVFGGTSGTVSVVVQGLSSQSYFGSSKVHATVWGVDSTVSNPSSGPYYVQMDDYTESSGQITVSVPSTKATSAYYLIVTPAKSLSSVNSATKYEANTPVCLARLLSAMALILDTPAHISCRAMERTAVRSRNSTSMLLPVVFTTSISAIRRRTEPLF